MPVQAYIQVPSDHPWDAFLEARKRALVWLRNEMKESPEASARTMSMGPMQVILILMHADGEPRRTDSA